MTLESINELINELENVDASLSNVRNLASLYIVKQHFIGSEKFDSTLKELNDILPSYVRYVDTKRKYQMHELPESALYTDMKFVCKEIFEFIQTLYSGTDTTKEQQILQDMINNLKNLF